MPGKDVSKNWIRERQFSPSKCRKGTFRTKVLSKKKQVVLCKKKGSRKQSVQSIRTRRKNGKKSK